MNNKEIKTLLRSRERNTLEFKEARNALPRSFFETVCAFLNGIGGTVLLGVADDGRIIGVIYRDRVETSNAAIPHGHGLIRPDRFTPFPKNPTLSKFFMQMGRGEELGSGVLNVHKYVPFYAKGVKPRFIEGDPFVAIIPLPQEAGDDGVNGQGKASEKAREKTREKILNLLNITPTMTTAELAVALGLTDKGVAWQLKRLQENGRLRRVGPDKGGHWDVILRAGGGGHA